MRCGVPVVLAIGVVLGACGITGQSPGVVWYRLSTTLKALHACMTMPEEHVENFIKSYALFDKEVCDSDEDWKMIVDYYTVVNQLCAVGDVEKMYIPPVMDLSLGIFGNQLKWEEEGMVDKLDIGPGKKVLDVGCGRGRIMHHVASYSGAHVTGLNIDKGQIKMGKDYAEATGLLDKQLSFLEGNYNKKLPFADNTFDALYHVQALSYAQDLPILMKELYRVIKPGAKISMLDWFKLPAYKPEDPHHKKLLRDVKMVIGAVRTPAPEDYDIAMKAAGFEILFSGEASKDGGHQWPLVMQADAFYTNVKSIVDFLTQWKIIPGHFKRLLERLTEGGESFVEADKMGLFTTSWQIIAQKPLK